MFKVPVFVSLAIVGFTLNGLADQSQRSATGKSGPFLPIPPRVTDLLSAIQQVAVASRQATGVEVVVGGATPPRAPVPQAGGFVLDLSGLSPVEAVEKITQRDIQGPLAKYEWDSSGGVVHVRPRSFRNNRTVVLNKHLKLVSFEAKGALDALHRVHRLLDPDMPSARASGPALSRAPEAVRRFMEVPISISLTDATVRQVLDEIAIKVGTASWVAEYQDPGGSLKGLKLSFVGFDKWTVSSSARPR